jgi:hypothetical protein
MNVDKNNRGVGVGLTHMLGGVASEIDNTCSLLFKICIEKH